METGAKLKMYLDMHPTADNLKAMIPLQRLFAKDKWITLSGKKTSFSGWKVVLAIGFSEILNSNVLAYFTR